MADQSQEFGMDVVLANKLICKYDQEREREVIDWIKALTNENLPSGREQLFSSLKDGRVLCKLINTILSGTQNIPMKARALKCPIRFNSMKVAFKQMENIDQFLFATHAYGVPEVSLFKTVDLFECQNMAQVLNTLLQLGTECQRNGFNGPVCGASPTYTNHRQFSTHQLKSSDAIIGLQMGTNKCASQKGMQIGTARHIGDIKVCAMDPQSNGVISPQMGTNQYASQKGMVIGGTRHASDIKVASIDPSSHSTVILQSGSNRGASQKGMSFGSQRHVNDMNIGPASLDSQAILPLQSGPSQKRVASQSGMSFGSMRNIAAYSQF